MEVLRQRYTGMNRLKLRERERERERERGVYDVRSVRLR